jgi:hypothetical protein
MLAQRDTRRCISSTGARGICSVSFLRRMMIVALWLDRKSSAYKNM